jgi:hypothetical protein
VGDRAAKAPVIPLPPPSTRSRATETATFAHASLRTSIVSIKKHLLFVRLSRHFTCLGEIDWQHYPAGRSIQTVGRIYDTLSR